MTNETQKINDEELIREILRNSSNQTTGDYNPWKMENGDFILNIVDEIVTEMIKPENREYFLNKLKGRKLFDLGAGITYLPMEIIKSTDSHNNKLRFNPEVSELVLVDPFNEQMIWDEFSHAVKFVKADALEFLISQPDNSGNIITSGLAPEILRHPDEKILDQYLERVAEEIHRVVPVGGIYVSADSYGLECRAKERFGNSRRVGFYDPELPSLASSRVFVFEKNK